MFFLAAFWDQFITVLPNLPKPVADGLNLILSLLIASALTFIWVKLIKHVFNPRIRTRLIEKLKIRSVSRVQTLTDLFQNALLYLVYFIYIYFVLSRLGVPIGTLIAGAGIVGIAIGLGAKDLITDIINGFFIIFEGQFQVGDEVTIHNLKISGKVLGLGLRTTRIKSVSGEIFYIPNSDITIINNMSRLNRNVLIDIPLDLAIPMETFEAIIKHVNTEIIRDHDDVLVTPPDTIGIIKGPGQRYYYRINICVNNAAYYTMTSECYRAYFLAFQKAGYLLPLQTLNSTH